MKKKTCVLFSGGKDSMYALQESKFNNNLDFIISIKNPKGDAQFHAGAEIDDNLRKTQLNLIGLPYREVLTKTKNYLKDTFSQLKKIVEQENIKYIITGDLWFPYGMKAGDKLAKALGVEILRPCRSLCCNKQESQKYMDVVLNSKIKSIVYGVRKNVLPRKFIGQKIDKEFLKELGRRKVDTAGEKSEYQSLVVASPIMSKKIIVDSFDIKYAKGRLKGDEFYMMNNVRFHTE